VNDSDDIFHDANARGTVRISTRAIIGLGFTVAATLAVTACQSGGARSSGGESTPSATVASDPRQALQGGVAAVSRSTFRLHFTTPSADVTGSIDPAGEKGDLTAVATMLNGRKGTSEVRQLGRDYWIKLDLGGAPQPNPWMHVDPAKVKRPDQMYFADHNVTGTETLMHNLVTVTRSGGQYTGTVDLSQSITKTSTSNLRYFELDTNRTTALGATAKSLPFSATSTSGVD